MERLRRFFYCGCVNCDQSCHLGMRALRRAFSFRCPYGGRACARIYVHLACARSYVNANSKRARIFVLKCKTCQKEIGFSPAHKVRGGGYHWGIFPYPPFLIIARAPRYFSLDQLEAGDVKESDFEVVGLEQ